MALNGFTEALKSTDEIEITVTGRKFSRKISNPVWFVKEGKTLYLLPVKGTCALRCSTTSCALTLRCMTGFVQVCAILIASSVHRSCFIEDLEPYRVARELLS